ncbi:DUF1217 domain-containing protein [Roseovarius sp. SYSU LYC5161]|uniref:DUF1217 domain-containing protein n=1 Tax=Roseovarius halophilus (ex Wu et al. 2025) TaxID=3376060 RepID=UPI002870B526|nr:DUF1217 domain-containing protein [Roseovarius sp.]
MSFQPALPMSGLAGWSFLNQTLDRQTEIFDKSPRIARDTKYFEATIGDVRSAEALVGDRRLLRVALGAFGLQEDLNNRAFIRQVLEEGVTDENALANRLSDNRYTRLAAAFGFGDGGSPESARPGFGAEITERFRRMAFESAVGDEDQALRLAMNAKRELADVAGADQNDAAKWYRVLGTPPLRQVFETAFGLPEGFAQLDLERQVAEFRDRATAIGIDSISDLADEQTREELVRRFLAQDELAKINAPSSNAIALTLLQSAPGPA